MQEEDDEDEDESATIRRYFTKGIGPDGKPGVQHHFCVRIPHEMPQVSHPGGNPGANLNSISHRCYLFEVAFVWELTKETIVLPLGCLQGGGQQMPHSTVPNPS